MLSTHNNVVVASFFSIWQDFSSYSNLFNNFKPLTSMYPYEFCLVYHLLFVLFWKPFSPLFCCLLFVFDFFFWLLLFRFVFVLFSFFVFCCFCFFPFFFFWAQNLIMSVLITRQSDIFPDIVFNLLAVGCVRFVSFSSSLVVHQKNKSNVYNYS